MALTAASEKTCIRLPTPQQTASICQSHAGEGLGSSTTMMMMVIVRWFLLFVCFWLATCQSDTSHLPFRAVTKCPTQACTMPVLGRKNDSAQSIKSLSFPTEARRNARYMTPGLLVYSRVKFLHCAACGQRFIVHPPSNATADRINNEMLHAYLETMAIELTAWRTNKMALPQPFYPKTGKKLMKVAAC